MGAFDQITRPIVKNFVPMRCTMKTPIVQSVGSHLLVGLAQIHIQRIVYYLERMRSVFGEQRFVCSTTSISFQNAETVNGYT